MVNFHPVLQQSAEVLKLIIRSSTKPSRPTSASVRQLTPREGVAELPHRAAAAPAFSCWIFVSDHADDSALRRHVPSSNCSSEYRQQKKPRRQSVFAGVHFRRGGRRTRQCVYLEVHISDIPLYTCVYLSRTLRKTRDLRQTRMGYTRLLNDIVLTTPLDPGLVIGSASSRSEIERVGSPFVSES